MAERWLTSRSSQWLVRTIDAILPIWGVPAWRLLIKMAEKIIEIMEQRLMKFVGMKVSKSCRQSTLMKGPSAIRQEFGRYSSKMFVLQ